MSVRIKSKNSTHLGLSFEIFKTRQKFIPVCTQVKLFLNKFQQNQAIILYNQKLKFILTGNK